MAGGCDSGSVSQSKRAKVSSYYRLRCTCLSRHGGERLPFELIEESTLASIGLSNNDDGVAQPFKHLALSLLPIHRLHKVLDHADIGGQVAQGAGTEFAQCTRSLTFPKDAAQNILLELLAVFVFLMLIV